MAHEPQASVSLVFLTHSEVFCDLLLNRPTATWNLFVLYDDQKRNLFGLIVLQKFLAQGAVLDFLEASEVK